MDTNLKGFLMFLFAYIIIMLTHYFSDINGLDNTLVWTIETITLIATTIIYFAKKCKRFNKFVYPISFTIILLWIAGIFQDKIGWGFIVIYYGLSILIPILFIIGWVVDSKQKQIK